MVRTAVSDSERNHVTFSGLKCFFVDGGAACRRGRPAVLDVEVAGALLGLKRRLR